MRIIHIVGGRVEGPFLLEAEGYSYAHLAFEGLQELLVIFSRCAEARQQPAA